MNANTEIASSSTASQETEPNISVFVFPYICRMCLKGKTDSLFEYLVKRPRIKNMFKSTGLLVSKSHLLKL